MVSTQRASRSKTKDKAVVTKQRSDNLSIKNPVRPLNESQKLMMSAFEKGLNVLAYGSAGTGKSYVACHLALKKLFSDPRRNKIVIVRSAVQTRDMGFLPGSLDEKTDPYKAPYKSIINQLCDNGTAWETLTKKGIVEFITSSYIRGITLEDCTIIVDEFANCTWHEMNSIVTRVGENSQMILLGDIKQCDLNSKKEQSCFNQLLAVVAKLPKWFNVVEFTPDDIVRSEFVRDWIKSVEN
jgi:phosphate starvation-inducible protein PhoH